MATTDTGGKLVTLDELKSAATSSKGYTASQISALSDAVEEDLSAHTSNTSNPHNVTVSQIGAAASSHTHSASSITSGTLAVARGGTGTTTGHIAITAGTDTTSTASPAHGGTFTAIDGITKDSYGHVTAVNTKTVTLPSDNNTDTKVTQTVTTTSAEYPILMTATASQTATATNTSRFGTGITANPSTSTVKATTFSGTLSGNATTATALATARTVRTNLASTSTASFDGSANITPGVTGTLPIANGGTGNTTGLAASATKLATAQAVDGVSFDGSAAITHYGTCSTAAATAAKVVSLTGFSLVTGARVSVKFTYANTASSPTLNVNSTGAISIMRYGTTAATTNMWIAGAVVDFIYDGTNWVMENGTTATTTYYGLAKLSSSTSSTSTSLAATPSAVKAAYDLASGKADASSSASGTLSSSSWTKATDANGDAYYYQAVAVSDVTADTNGIVGLADSCTADEYEAAASAGLSIYSQSSGSIVIAAYGEVPDVDIRISIILLG